MIDLDKIRRRWRGVYAVDGIGKVGPSELPPDIAALCIEVGRLRELLQDVFDNPTLALSVGVIHRDMESGETTGRELEGAWRRNTRAALAAPPTGGEGANPCLHCGDKTGHSDGRGCDSWPGR